MQVSVKLTLELDIVDLEYTLDNIEFIDCKLECDNITTIHGSDLDEQIEYLVNCAELGDTYESYCDELNQFVSKDDYETALIGEYSSLAEYAQEMYTDILSEVPEIIGNNIDWESVASDLESDLVVIDVYRKGIAVFSA